MAKSKAEVNFMEHLKPLLPAGGDACDLEAAAQALAGLSPEDRDLLAAVQESPFRLTTLEQFREFPANTEYFILEPNVSKVEDVGWRYLAQHLDVLLPPELLDAIDPVPFGNHAMQEEQGCFTSRGYLTLSGDEWEHERPRERQTEKSPPSKNGWNRAGRNVPTRARRSPIGKSLRRSDKEVSLCPIMTMTKIIPLPLSSPTWANTTRAPLWANG